MCESVMSARRGVLIRKNVLLTVNQEHWPVDYLQNMPFATRIDDDYYIPFDIKSGESMTSFVKRVEDKLRGFGTGFPNSVSETRGNQSYCWLLYNNIMDSDDDAELGMHDRFPVDIASITHVDFILSSSSY